MPQLAWHTLEILLDKVDPAKGTIVAPRLYCFLVKQPAAEGDDADASGLQDTIDLSKHPLWIL